MRGRFNGRVIGMDHNGRNTRHNGRAGIYNAVQSAFAPSLDITLANGLGPLFTYTRAFTATVTDFEGLIKNCLSGELRIYGARRVHNLLPSTNADLTTGWTKTNVTVTTGVSDPFGGTRAVTLTGTGAVAYFLAIANSGSTFVTSMWIRRRTGTSPVKMYTPAGAAGATVALTSSWQRFAATPGAGSGGNVYVGIQTLASGDEIDVAYIQPENVTGQANQNPSEDVSVGVTSSPSYHGYFADGIKYFSYANGNTVASNVVTEAQGAAITGTIGYLPEGARTNLCLYSNALTSAWSEVGTTETTQNVTGPDGATSAWTMTDSDVGVTEHRWQGINISSGTTYTYSYFIKKTTGALTAYPVLQVYDPTANKMAGGTIDTTNGTIAKWTAYTGTTMMASFSVNVENFNADYWRVWLTFTAESSNTHRVYLIPAGRSSYSTTGPNDVAATGSAVYYGAQFEAGAFPSTYQPTGAAAVARNADVLSAPSAGILNSAAMTIAMRWAPTAAGQGTVFLWGTHVDADNYTAVLHDGTNMIARKRIAGVNHDATKALAYVADTSYRITARFDSTNGCDIWVDGVKGTNDSTTTAAQVGTTFQIGCDGNSANHSFAVIPTFKAYRSGLSDTQAAAL